RTLLGGAIAASLLFLTACGGAKDPDHAPADNQGTVASESADAFVERLNRTLEEMTPEITSAQWLASTYINTDSQRVAAAANERWLAARNAFIEQARQFDPEAQSPATARALHLLTSDAAMPAPRDPAKLKELTEIASRMEAAYGAGKWCRDAAGQDCLAIRPITELLADSAKRRLYELPAARHIWRPNSRLP